MKYVKLYDHETKTEKTIPMSELSPDVIPASKEGGPLVWVDPSRLKPNYRPLHPRLNGTKRKIIRRLSETLAEVFPQSFKSWEFQFRCDQHPDREIRIWRWIAWQYRRLTEGAPAEPELKQDLFQLCLRWTMSKDPESVIQTVALKKLPRELAAEMLMTFAAIPAEFIGGDIARVGRGGFVWDYSAIRSLQEFKSKVADASVIYAVDWDTGRYEIIYGMQTLREVAAGTQPKSMLMAHFAVDYQINEPEHVCAAVLVTKGWYESNGVIHRSKSSL